MTSSAPPDGPRFAAPHVVAAPGRLPDPPPPPRRRGVGVLALVLAVVVAGAGTMIAVIVAGRLGGSGAVVAWLNSDGDLRALSPVRTEVLVGEVAFWTCTVLGVAAIVLGSIAIARRSGRGLGVTAIAVALVAPVVASGAAVATVFVTA